MSIPQEKSICETLLRARARARASDSEYVTGTVYCKILDVLRSGAFHTPFETTTPRGTGPSLHLTQRQLAARVAKNGWDGGP